MSRKYYFSGTRNDKVLNPSAEYIEDFIDNTDVSYWNDNVSSGDAALYFEGEEEKMLLFFYEEKYGFFLFNLDYEIPLNFSYDLNNNFLVSHRIGGEPMNIPSIGFRTKEETLQILKYFIAERGQSPDFKWVNLFELEG